MNNTNPTQTSVDTTDVNADGAAYGWLETELQETSLDAQTWGTDVAEDGGLAYRPRTEEQLQAVKAALAALRAALRA